MNIEDFKKLKDNLTLHPGILCKEEYLNTAVLIPLVKISSEYHLLFEKRAAEIRQGGEICFPGGEYNKVNDPDFKGTAVRETVEELGIDRKNIEVIGELGVLIGPMGITINAFVGELKVKDLTEFNIDKTEVERISSLPVKYFKENPPEEYYVRLETHPYYFDEKGEKIILLPAEELKLPARYSNPWGFRKRKVLLYRAKEEVIWGLTANLIFEFVNRI